MPTHTNAPARKPRDRLHCDRHCDATDGAIAAGDAANSMMYKVTADTTFKIYNLNAVANTTVTGDGVNISAADSEAGRAAYLLGRVTYIRPAADVSWNDIQGFVDFASQVGGTDS